MKAFNSLVFALGAALCACGTGGGSPPDAGPPQNPLEIGTGGAYFEPLTDGQDVQIITGPQGGHHIWGALRATHALNPKIDVHYYVILEDGGVQISDNPYSHLTLSPNGPYNEWYGMIGLLPEPDGVATVNGQPTILRMEVTDADGKTASDQRHVIPRYP